MGRSSCTLSSMQKLGFFSAFPTFNLCVLGERGPCCSACCTVSCGPLWFPAGANAGRTPALDLAALVGVLPIQQMFGLMNGN